MPGSAGPRAVTGEQIRGWHTQSLRQTVVRRGVRLVQTALVPTDAYTGHKTIETGGDFEFFCDNPFRSRACVRPFERTASELIFWGTIRTGPVRPLRGS